MAAIMNSGHAAIMNSREIFDQIDLIYGCDYELMRCSAITNSDLRSIWSNLRQFINCDYELVGKNYESTGKSTKSILFYGCDYELGPAGRALRL